MASAPSTQTVSGGVRFSADFIANIPRYQQAIRSHRVMPWARQRALEDDLEQLALIDLARVEARFDPARATSPHHFRLAVLGSRVSDCASLLMRMHREVTGEIEDTLDAGDQVDDDDVSFADSEYITDDPVLDRAIRAQVARAVYEAIPTLPFRQRQVIELALEDCSDREIAEQLGVSVQAVNKSRLAAIANLKQVVLAKFPNN
jgi:RNA polymerase sigma factor (sigma-70 family)